MNPRKLITISIIGFFVSSNVALSEDLSRDKRSEEAGIIISTTGVDREYKLLGPVIITYINPLVLPSTEELNNLLRKKAIEQYKDVDAIIKVRYGKLPLISKKKGRVVSGAAVKFIANETTPVTPPPPAPAGKWEKIRQQDVANLSSEWNSPVWISEVNSEGWEDGSYISPDGNQLFFAYINIDLLKQPKIVITGPNRDPQGIGKPPCGQFPRADVFYTTKDTSGKRKTPIPHPLTVPYPIGGIVLANEDRAYFHMEKQDGLATEIYFAQRIAGVWQNPQKIDALSSPGGDDDPHIMPNDEEIFFWSTRPAALGGNNIYYSKKINGQWQAPALLPEPINSNANDMQPFVTGNTIYFTSDRDGKPKIYKSVFENDKWSNPEVIISGKNAVGEPTLTKDGKFIYFVQIFVSDQMEFNPDIMCAQRK